MSIDIIHTQENDVSHEQHINEKVWFPFIAHEYLRQTSQSSKPPQMSVHSDIMGGLKS